MPDTLAFEVVGGTPGRGNSRFWLSHNDFSSAAWRPQRLFERDLPERELLIEVQGGAFTIAIDPRESESDPG